MNISYLPEGYRVGSAENREYLSSLSSLERAMREGKILESTVLLCDSNLCLRVDLFGVRGTIPREEVMLCRDGEEIKDIAIITRVGKPVAFKILRIEYEGGQPHAILSRRAAQEECMRCFLADCIPGDILPARVTHLEGFGAFVDIGCGIASLLSVDGISVSRISHPSDRLRVGDRIYVVVKTVDRRLGRIFVSMRELLGTWEENARAFAIGQTVSGIVRSVESYGVFVELAPNLAGLAELREGSRDRELAIPGERVAVYIKNMIPDRMKIKLVLIDSYRGESTSSGIHYFVDCERVRHLDAWCYSTPTAHKRIETVFEAE